MLPPHEDSSEEASFTIGQRLRQNRMPKKRTHVVSYGSAPHGKGNPSPLCTRTRCLLFTFFVVVGTVYILNLPLWTQSRPVEVEEVGGEENPNAPAPTSPTVLAAQASARLAEREAELEASQAAMKRLNQDLEYMRQKVETAEATAEKAAVEAKRAIAAAAAAAAVAPSTSSSPVALSSSGFPIEVPSYPPIAIASSKKFSKFYCIGGRGRLDAANDRSCRFQNVCYKPSTDQWQFFADPQEELVVLLDEGRIISEFPKEFLNLRSMGNPTDAQWWSPSIVRESSGIPAEAFVPREDPSKPLTHILYHPHYPSNMGHVIGDDLFPLFNLMSSFGMLTKDAQLIISRDCGKIFSTNEKKTEQCDHFLNMLLPGLTSRKYLAATQPDFVSAVRGGSNGGPEDLVCFEQLLVGNGPWGFQQSLGKAPAWWSYHAFYLSNLGINPNRTPKKQRITVSIKKGKRSLANNDEVVAHLRKTFPEYEVDALELRSLGGWKAELEYLLDTSILVTPCGGVSMSAMFLPHNAALVVVDYFNLRKNVSFGMEERLWTNLGYIRPFHYPFTLDEVEMPPDHPRRDDYQEMRDWGQVRVNVERMATVVKAAVSHTENFMVMGQQ